MVPPAARHEHPQHRPAASYLCSAMKYMVTFDFAKEMMKRMSDKICNLGNKEF